jgi:phosphate transport system substrate-binding protein
MMRRSGLRIPRLARLVLAIGAAGPLAVMPAGTAGASTGFVPITGSGSSWSEVAIDAWRADVHSEGLVVNYSGNGSSAGRADYIDNQSQFAVSEIPFENPPEPGQQAEIPKRPYAYLPIVAGGTSFMYHITVNGHLYRSLRLSSQTLTKIFTGSITNWSDPAITKDTGLKLPSEAIIPVLRADGAGSSAQFSRFMWRQFPSLWCPFQAKYEHIPTSQCGLTSFFPTFGQAKAQVGDNGVADYVSASYGEGAIGFVEYAYAKQLSYPVASILNAAGYYTQPSAGNVAVALTQAKINHVKSSPTYLTQNLDQVYTNKDPRTYSLSSYSYMIVPTTTAAPFDQSGDGRSLSTFINYFLCAGQQKAQILGYSPVPKNLVQAGFQQVRRIPGYVSPPPIASCHNPALNILQTAPKPAACEKVGATPCGTTSNGTPNGTSTGNGSSNGSGNGNGNGNGSGTPSSNPTTGTTGASGTGGAGSGGGGAGGATTTVDPVTGATVTTGSTTGGASAAVPVALSADRGTSSQTTVLYLLSAVLLLAAVVAPPLSVVLRRRRNTPR